MMNAKMMMAVETGVFKDYVSLIRFKNVTIIAYKPNVTIVIKDITLIN